MIPIITNIMLKISSLKIGSFKNSRAKMTVKIGAVAGENKTNLSSGKGFHKKDQQSFLFDY
jgi:hypothetical protein